MKSLMWIYILNFFLAESWSDKTGSHETTSEQSNTNNKTITFDVNRKETFKPETSVNLTCSNKTWDELIYVIWTIQLKHKFCKISISNEEKLHDSCNDGKATSRTKPSYLHIPGFSMNDVGVYQCEAVYAGGSENYNISVTAMVPPQVFAGSERRGNKTVAVCQAMKGNPEARIRWNYSGKNTTKINTDPDGLVSVESQLELPVDMNLDNLSCIVQHQLWIHDKTLKPKPILEPREALQPWIFILTFGITAVLVVALLIFAVKKVKYLQQCQASETPIKSPPIGDVEEVEPYASYVQRVNSIYN